MFFKTGVLKNFAIFTGKKLWWSFFLITLQASVAKHTLKILQCEYRKIFKICLVLEVCNFIKKRLQHRCFPVNIAKFSLTPFSQSFCEIPCFWWHFEAVHENEDPHDKANYMNITTLPLVSKVSETIMNNQRA